MFSRINSNPLLISAQKQMLLVEEVGFCHHHHTHSCANRDNFDHIPVVIFVMIIILFIIIIIITLIII